MVLCHFRHFYIEHFLMHSINFELCMLGFRNFIFGFLMKKKADKYFFFLIRIKLLS